MCENVPSKFQCFDTPVSLSGAVYVFRGKLPAHTVNSAIANNQSCWAKTSIRLGIESLPIKVRASLRLFYALWAYRCVIIKTISDIL